MGIEAFTVIFVEPPVPLEPHTDPVVSIGCRFVGNGVEPQSLLDS
jgi:hypothetical protein